MLKTYEVVVRYKVFANDGAEATGKVIHEQVDIETLDVYEEPSFQPIQLDVVPF